MSEDARSKYTAVVEGEDVSRAKMFRQISEVIVFEPAGCSIEHEHSRSRPVKERLLRNQLFWKMKIEVRDKHAPPILRAPKTKAFTRARQQKHAASKPVRAPRRPPA